MTEETNHPATYLVKELKDVAEGIANNIFSYPNFYLREAELSKLTAPLAGLMERVGHAAMGLTGKEKAKIVSAVRESGDLIIKRINEQMEHYGYTEAEWRTLPPLQKTLEGTRKAIETINSAADDMTRVISGAGVSPEAQFRFAFDLAQQHKKAASAVIESLRNGEAASNPQAYDAKIDNVASLRSEIDLAVENLPLPTATQDSMLSLVRTNAKAVTKAIAADADRITAPVRLKAQSDIAKITGTPAI